MSKDIEIKCSSCKKNAIVTGSNKGEYLSNWQIPIVFTDGKETYKGADGKDIPGTLRRIIFHFPKDRPLCHDCRALYLLAHLIPKTSSDTCRKILEAVAVQDAGEVT